MQGVGFRQFILREARSLGLCGAVRNRPDGSVDVEVEGDLRHLGQLLERARRGPPGAVVTEVATQWGEGPPRFEDFRVGP